MWVWSSWVHSLSLKFHATVQSLEESIDISAFGLVLLLHMSIVASRARTRAFSLCKKHRASGKDCFTSLFDIPKISCHDRLVAIRCFLSHAFSSLLMKLPRETSPVDPLGCNVKCMRISTSCCNASHRFRITRVLMETREAFCSRQAFAHLSQVLGSTALRTWSFSKRLHLTLCSVRTSVSKSSSWWNGFHRVVRSIFPSS